VDQALTQSGKSPVSNAPPRASRGLLAAFAAYLAWGLFPVYFRALRQVSPLSILAHRIVWSVGFLVLLLAWTGRLRSVRGALFGPGFRVYLISTALISSNWLLFIWAVNAGHVLDSSLGYFINPLMNVVLGIAFLGERLRMPQAVAVALATAGVLALTVHLGTVPWISLVLASTFALYGFVRKSAHIEPFAGLLIETTILLPFAVFYLGLEAIRGVGMFGPNASTAALLVSTGVVTATPLIWFAVGVRTLRLSTMGLVQYVSPTSQFLLAVIVYREPFTRAHGVAFACIWLGLVLYTWDALRHAAVQGARERPGRAAA
jgi:chloramphenicol-sensitive protein RarD